MRPRRSGEERCLAHMATRPMELLHMLPLEGDMANKQQMTKVPRYGATAEARNVVVVVVVAARVCR